MSERDDVGHAPAEPHDRRFAPVNRGSDARGGTVPEVEREKEAEGVSGTGVPGVDGAPDSLPPTEEGVREAERGDDSR
ncbi:hypothetical protein [Thermomonospora umbrina]|uniref:Uncharacterized protein n=1 Tax=Thermomonospora umbrina TaxID=111806 RepID=A0A3D9SGZ9_9ACTN|nr:hypothetical protein [Thermomonospora umbrina]REE95188.1 hypothetical protein DFJ69_0570 [Thermomonospora umbrina]